MLNCHMALTSADACRSTEHRGVPPQARSLDMGSAANEVCRNYHPQLHPQSVLADTEQLQGSGSLGRHASSAPFLTGKAGPGSTIDLAMSQLLSSFPSTPTATEMGQAIRLSDSSVSSGPPAAASTTAHRSAMGGALKRSRLHRASHFSDEMQEEHMASHASTKHHKRLQSCNKAYTMDREVEDAARTLLLLAHAVKPQQTQQIDPSAQQEIPQHRHSDLAAIAAAAATGLLANSFLPVGDLIAAAQELSRYNYSQKAALDARHAGVHATSAQANPAYTSAQPHQLIEELIAATHKLAQSLQGQQTVKDARSAGVHVSSPQSTPKALHSSPSTITSSSQHAELCWPATPTSTSPFAAFASACMPSPAGFADEMEDAEARVDNATAFASFWVQQDVQQCTVQLPPIKVRSNAQPQRQSPLASPVFAKAMAVPAEEEFDAFTGMQSPQMHKMGPVTPPSVKLPSQRRKLHAVRASSDQSVFSREVVDNVDEEAQTYMRARWAATGRVAVTCGPAGSAGISGIFTLNSAGKPVIWAPKDPAAAARLIRVVAAGGGQSLTAAVPAGYEEIEPKVFEERAGKGRSRNWQMSIAVPGFSCGMMASAGQKQPFALKLGHFTRICGIPTAKQ